ncbi:MAG TPA: glycoside hydrolase family 38 C-terminal domain-containing protein [Candidatus Methylacidiphilales bacterium]
MKDILFVPHPHFDPVWRRCFDRPARRHGVTVRSYAEVEALCIDTWLEIAPDGYPFNDGQTAIWRKYLEKNPGKREALRREARRGTLDLVRAGEVVPDTNMPTAEGLVRNFLLAQPLYEELAGPDHPGLKLAWLEDAFGHSANYPQILKGVGAEVACATTYRVCPGPVWTGIDGTSILCYDYYPAIRMAGVEKHPPCPDCSGKGCKACDGTGMRLFEGYDVEKVQNALEEAASRPGDWIVVSYLTEELLPDRRMAGILDDFNRRHAGKAKARFANPSGVYERYLPELKKALAKTKDPKPTLELNPAMPGCMVSRIRCKQRTRGIAYLLMAAEARLATRSWAQKKPAAPSRALTEAWRDVCFNQFHDAITGTHIDTAYDELMEMLDRAEKTGRRLLKQTGAAPAPQAAPPVFKPILRKGPQSATWGPFRLTYDKTGIHSILMGKEDVFGVLPGWTVQKRPVRIGELVLDADFGDAWGQRIADFGADRLPLGDFHDTVEAAPRALRWTGRYRGGDPKVAKLSWRVTASLSEDGRRIDFATEVDWDTSSRRLRALFPVASQEADAAYEIPFGFIRRTYDPAKLDYGQWRANTMEFPALHWVHREVSPRSGVAILNRGLPCFRWKPGCFDLSLLRSPEWAFCSVEPAHYEFWDIDGQRDTGRHRLEYSLWPYADGRNLGGHELTAAGYAYNRPEPLALPFRIEGDAIITAWKEAEDGSGWIVRLQNTTGRPATAVLSFDDKVEATEVDLLERPEGAPRRASIHRVSLRRHGIATRLLRR